ncbi:hypothetical protein Hanom_Chr08g00724881 [Helianthus anomalus]
MEGISFWYVDDKTREAVITKKKVTEVIVKVLDPMWLVNYKLLDLKKFKCYSLQYLKKDREIILPFIRVVQFCLKNKIGAGSYHSKI